uniref:Integrase catalytic domain-containing protein n=1 Tax=Cannabis sativa TaxID=3483 RepID=A0A803PVB6_CANSA
MDKEELKELGDDKKKIKEIETKSHSAILLSLGDEMLRKVSNEETALGLWEILASIYLKKSLANKLYLKKKLYTLKMEDSKELRKHLGEFNQIILDLSNIGVKIEDEDQGILLLSSLPKSYEHFVDTILYGKETLAMTEAKAALNSKEIQKKNDERTDGIANSLFVKTRNNSKDSRGGYNKTNYKNNQNKGHSQGYKPKAKSKQGKQYYYYKKEGHFRDESLVMTSQESECEWILDSGCSFHVKPRRELFSDIKKIEGGSVLLGDNKACKISGMGSVLITMNDGQVKLIQEVMEAVLGKTNLVVKNSDRDNTRLWHMRLGHVSERGLYELEKQGILKGKLGKKLRFCEECVYGKCSRVKFTPGLHTTKGKLDYVHSHLWGASRTKTIGGASYYMSIIDDYTRRVWVLLLKTKDEAFKTFVNWKKLIENQRGRKIKKLRIDNGLEYCSYQFTMFCQDNGIARHKNVIKTPQQNGIVERMNRTLLERDYKLVRDRVRRDVRPPERLGYVDCIAFALAAEIEKGEPTTYVEAVARKNRKKSK